MVSSKTHIQFDTETRALTIVGVRVSYHSVLVLTCVEIRHQRRNVLRCRKPGVHVSASVEETPGGDCDVLDFVTIKGEAELERDGGGPAVRRGQHRVFYDFSSCLVQMVQIDESLAEVLLDILIVFFRIFILKK